MKIDLSFKFSTQTVAAGKYLFFAQVDYTMFPELQEEFEGQSFPVNELQVMETNLEDEGFVGYNLEMEVPYGHYETKIFFKALAGQNADEGTVEELKPLPDELLKYFSQDCVPKPISKDQQRELDDQEEKDNKEKEREARQAQKELEQRKAKQKAEAQMQLLKQE